MTKEDVFHLATTASNSQIVAVHMEAWNHCQLRREELREYLTERGVIERVAIPLNGERLAFHPQGTV